MTSTPLVCERCGIPHAGHPDSARHGGVPFAVGQPDRLCVVCHDYLTNYRVPQWDPVCNSTDAAQETLDNF